MPTKGYEEIFITSGRGSGRTMTYEYLAELFSDSLTTRKKELANQEKLNPDNIEKVIFNPPATIVVFKDGSKIVTKAHAESFDAEKGLAMAMMRLIFPTRADFNRLVDKSIGESGLVKK